ncbi:MAG: phosphoribosylformylglycinamidine cyclo-ligase [Thermoguttaceae bacterium]|nr:phosphoribosylformylglycinamidine cyclo-ligase [Thermoguttaceae bacterium]
MAEEKATYKNSGVDLSIYATSMEKLPGIVAKTFTPRVMRLDGGFAGLFSLNGKISEDGPAKKYTDPVLVSCTDGVGTKIKIACAANRHDTVGIDLVAMSVNDAICCGAAPLFFLDYVAMPKDNPTLLERIVSGIAEGCKSGGAALIGGETAILPDMYNEGEYDLAGFCVGVAERSEIIDGKAIRENDILIGVASNGFHSNGYSLIRKAVFEMGGLSVATPLPEFENKTVADILLRPTSIYVRTVLTLLEKFKANDGIRGIAHITGGGLAENLGRILPNGLTAQIDENSWPVPPAFRWVQRLGNIDEDEMHRVFNMGIGLVLVVKPELELQVRETLLGQKRENWVLGKIVRG